MEKYKWYKIRHRQQGQQYDRKSVMQYLGLEEHAVNTVHLFNARPTAGTQTMPDSWIISVEEVPKPDKPYVAARW
jgi:hypothetical protein